MAHQSKTLRASITWHAPEPEKKEDEDTTEETTEDNDGG